MRRVFALLQLGVFVLPCLSASAQRDTGLSGTPLPTAQLVTRFLATEHVPGLAVAVIKNGVTVWDAAYGLEDMKTARPATVHTRFRIGSISKAISSVAILRASAAGLLDLDASIERYVPQYPRKRFPVILRLLLTGAGGVRGYVGNEYMLNQHFSSLAASLTLFAEDSLFYEPGTSYLETPYGFTLLALALESATHKPYEEYVNTEILRPLRMSETVVDSARSIARNGARPYTRDSLGVIRNADQIDLSYKVPASGWTATAHDLATFGSAIVNDRLLSPESYSEMTSPVRLRNGTELPLGMGIALGTAGGRLPGTKDAIWSTGIVQGGTSILLMYPHDRIAVAVVMNVNGDGSAESFRLLNHATQLADSIAVKFGRAP